MAHLSLIVAVVVLVLLVIFQKDVEHYGVVEVVGKISQGLLTIYIIGYVIIQALSWYMLG